MESHMLQTVKHLVETWDIRILMLCSLGIQLFLTFLAPYRKRCASSYLSFGMWLLYLAADSVALFTIGLIVSSQDNQNEALVKKSDLLTFWAPFLLLHLGGPDTITALALEDNELWHRHALQLVTQVVVTIYVFARSLRMNHLLLPTVLMFFDGLVKYFERTCALYFASMENFRDSQRTEPEPGSNYARLMEEYSCAASAHIPTEIKGKDGPVGNYIDEFGVGGRSFGGSQVAKPIQEFDESSTPKETDEMIQHAYQFFEKFKGLIADGFLSLKDRDESRTFFLNKCPHEAFRIVQIELNFMYDVFYTKVFLLHRRRGYARFICFISLIVSLIVFCFIDKSNYQDTDVGITFVLLGGAIILDTSTVIMFVLSDWWIITTNQDTRLEPLASLLKLFLKWSTRARGHGRSRWSESVSQYNLLNHCLNLPSPCFQSIFIRQIQDFLIGWWYVESKPLDHQLVKFIVEELQFKADVANDTQANQRLCSARGDLVFLEEYSFVAEYLRPWTVDVDYDESLLTWHFATDICYWTSTNKDRYAEFSKTISDYMSYLLLRQQALLSPVVGTSDVRFDDTCAEVIKFISNTNHTAELGQFCTNILEVKTDVRPIIAKGDKSKSVLFDSCRLAKQLNLFGEKQWLVTSKVWVELLCYASVRCTPRLHVALLSKGGELVTIVWLLAAHFGTGERFRQYRGFGWTKLIISK